MNQILMISGAFFALSMLFIIGGTAYFWSATQPKYKDVLSCYLSKNEWAEEENGKGFCVDPAKQNRLKPASYIVRVGGGLFLLSICLLIYYFIQPLMSK